MDDLLSDTREDGLKTITEEAAAFNEDDNESSLKSFRHLALELQTENDSLRNKLVEAENKIKFLTNENAELEKRSRIEYNDINRSLFSILQQYCEVGQCFERSKMEIKDLEKRLSEEQAKSARLEKEVLTLTEQFESETRHERYDEQSVEGVDECSLPEDDKLGVTDTQLHVLGSSPSANDIFVSCTLCGEQLRLDASEKHSKTCSAGMSSQQQTPQAPGMLVASVTRLNVDSQREDAFKIVTKTTLSSYDGTFFQVQRTKEDFLWLHSILKNTCHERIIPPLDLPSHVHGTLREMQRFLRRICFHKTLKGHDHLKAFLTTTTKEFEKIKKYLKKKSSKRKGQLVYRKPSKEQKDETGLLARSQKYVSELLHNLDDLKLRLDEWMSHNTNDGLSRCFQSISNSEANNTFLKMAADALAKIVFEADLDEVESDDAVLIENLSSLISFTKCAQHLLNHVDSTINTFLYWEEEMEVYEEMEKEGSITESNGDIVTKKWAEASAKCNEAKEELEHTCHCLSDELVVFDIQKEQEIKEILTDFAEGRAEQFEKLKSKWYSLKLILDTDIDVGVRGIASLSTGSLSV